MDSRGKPFIEPNKLFVDHHNNMYHGCPKFVEMSVASRKKVCFGALLCMKCLDPGVVYDAAHNAIFKITVDFKATKKKSKFTCKIG